MTKFDEMKEVALAAQRNFSQRQKNTWQHAVKLVSGFAVYCGIPEENIRVLRWNGDGAEPSYEEAESGYHYTASGAMKFDEESDSWRFGLRITLTGSQWVFFGLNVAEVDGKVLVSVGTDKPRKLDPNDQNQWNAFYDSVVEIIKGCYRDGIAERRAIGFTIST